jgi:hypothetical protein
MNLACVFPSREDEVCRVGGVVRGDVDACDGVFHGAAHSFMIVSRICDVGAVPCVWGVAAARREDNVFVV